jgi:hypothetical protein
MSPPKRLKAPPLQAVPVHCSKGGIPSQLGDESAKEESPDGPAQLIAELQRSAEMRLQGRAEQPQTEVG